MKTSANLHRHDLVTMAALSAIRTLSLKPSEFIHSQEAIDMTKALVDRVHPGLFIEADELIRAAAKLKAIVSEFAE